ncbi:AMP-binding protein [Rhizobium sp. RCC_161_2]|uniref:AMP-binding protein n=1 Tax=Rhizobium sp. RCC_161_2 TaxID=3239219 RepID=UPI003523987A
MYARYPIKGVTYPTEAEIAVSFNEGCALEKSAGNLIRDRARTLRDKILLISDKGTTTYGEFDRQTEVLAAALLTSGLRPGDRAIFQMGTVEDTLLALFGCYKSGLIPVCTLPQHREHEIAAMIERTRPRAYFVQRDFSPNFDLVAFANHMAERHGHVSRVISTGDCQGSLSCLATSMTYDLARSQLTGIEPDARDVLTLQLSGGSTGVPKIIPRFHGEYLGQASSVVRRHRLTSSDIALWPLPLIHNAAMVVMVFPIILTGGTLVLQSKFDRREFLDAIETNKVTYAGSIGPIAQSLLDDEDISTRDLRSMRMLFVLDRADAIERHVGVPTVNLYGITEGLLMTCDPADPRDLRFATTGYPTGLRDEIQVLQIDGEAPANEGQEGELCFRGPHMIRGYYDAPELNSTAFTKDGFYRTGDIVKAANVSGKTSFTFLGRLKDNISRGGEKFAAEEVEHIIVRHPAVVDAKIVAMPDRLLGEKACVFLVLRRGQPSPSVAELGRFLTESGLARYKHPERIEVVSEFPVTRVGKVDKAAMRSMVAERMRLEDQPAQSLDVNISEGV